MWFFNLMLNLRFQIMAASWPMQLGAAYMYTKHTETLFASNSFKNALSLENVSQSCYFNCSTSPWALYLKFGKGIAWYFKIFKTCGCNQWIRTDIVYLYAY